MAVRNFPDLRPVSVPAEHLLEVLAEDHGAAALLLDYQGTGSKPDPVVAQIREMHPELTILVVGKRAQRERSHRARMEQEIFSFIPLPLDPFDLARRLHRLVGVLAHAE